MGYNSSYLDKFAFSYIDIYTIATNKEKERSKKSRSWNALFVF